MKHHRGAVLAAAVLLGACAPHRQAPASAAPAARAELPGRSAGTAARARASIIPLVDHHQHIMGPVAITVQAQEPSLPTVVLPAALARLLEERERFSGAHPVGSSDRVYAMDAQVLDLRDAPWLRWRRGREAAAGVAAADVAGRRFVPHHFGIDGAAAFVSGVVRQAGADDRGYFALGAVRDARGEWRIATELVTPQPPLWFAEPITADRTIAVLDDAGIERAVVHSAAFWLGRSRGSPDEEYARVRAENDWVVAEVARFPERLVAFCGVNPLREHAVAEVRRCAALSGVRGIKLHFGNSRVDVTNVVHVAALQRVFRAANEQRLAVMVHLWTQGGTYGATHARIFRDSVLPHAPDVTVQIAHLAGGGGYSSDDALAVFADAITAGDPRLRHVYFDVATDVTEDQPPATLALIARRLRQIGLTRILFGADTPIIDRPPPVQAWATFRRRLPLTDDELRVIAGNVAPYLRGGAVRE